MNPDKAKQRIEAMAEGSQRMRERAERLHDEVTLSTTAAPWIRSDTTAISKDTQYNEGSVVEYGDGNRGVVVAVKTEDFTVPTGEDSERDVSASSDEPKYVVARETSGFGVYTADELSSGSFPDHEGGPDDITEAEGTESAMAKDVGWDRYPPTWRESSIPARVILLDVWSSVGASFSGCTRHFADEGVRVNKLCGSMKDEVLNTTNWRGSF